MHRRAVTTAICSIAVVAAAFAGSASADPAAPVDVAAARASLLGQWAGKLEYLDYSANKWFGIPVTLRVDDQGDGATTIRTADFDDGPRVGIVRITTVELFDAAKAEVSVASFRKGRSVSVDVYAQRLEPGAQDATHWTLVEETLGQDANRPARIRLTTVRDGDSVQTLKQIDFQDDDKAEWITRNRTTLTRVAKAAS